MRGPGGHRRIPYAMEQELRVLSPAQRSVLTSLAFEAQYGEPATVLVDGMTVRLDIGEALVSIRSLAARLRLGKGPKGEGLFRRSLESGVRIGLISTRPARPKGDAPCSARRNALRNAPRDAPPTIVRFLRHRETLWPKPNGDAPSDAPRNGRGDAQGDAIPQSTGHRSTGEEATRSPSAREEEGDEDAITHVRHAIEDATGKRLLPGGEEAAGLLRQALLGVSAEDIVAASVEEHRRHVAAGKTPPGSLLYYAKALDRTLNAPGAAEEAP